MLVKETEVFVFLISNV